MVIFGATGDLTKRKLFPALYNLAKENFLPKNFAIIGVGRQELETRDFRLQILENLNEFAGEKLEVGPVIPVLHKHHRLRSQKGQNLHPVNVFVRTGEQKWHVHAQ